MKCNIRHKAKWLVLAAILLSGCSGDDSPNHANNKGNKTEIKVNADVRRMMEETRATTVDNEEGLQAEYLRIDAYNDGTNTKYIDGAKLHYDSSWKFWGESAQLHYFWPTEGISTLDFVGYCPYITPTYISDLSYNYSVGTITFECDMSGHMTSTTQEDIKEFMYATTADQTYATQTESGGVPLQFQHPFARVKFLLSSASGTNVKVNSITISHLYTGGIYTQGTGWASPTGDASLEISGDPATGDTFYLVVPNNSGTKTFTVSATWTDWSNVTKDVSTNVSVNWQAGYSYTYTFTLSKYALKVETTSTYTEQW